MNEVGGDQSCFAFGDEALDRLHRTGAHEVDGQVGEVPVQALDEPGHGAGRNRHIDAHAAGARIDRLCRHLGKSSRDRRQKRQRRPK
jgi:hypothetical protein